MDKENGAGVSLDELWKHVLPLILKSPILLFSVFLSFLMGYGISFLLFDYRRKDSSVSKWIHMCLGVGYTALVFATINWKFLFGESTHLTLSEMEARVPQTMVIGFAAMFVIFFLVTIVRENRTA